MDKQIFLNSSMLPPLEFENTWKSLSSPMQTQSNLSHDCFLSSTPTSDQFDSTLTSMVSSPVTSYSNNNMLIKELAGKLSNICNNNNVANTSCYNTPLNSPPKMMQENSPYLEGNGEEMDAKRRKSDENGGGEEMKTEQNREDESKKQKQKTVEPPPKDYIHVRARRGQATDSHSLAERVRREKISERMKLLQDLVPGCNKVTGKALMLDEIINYVQSLQRQVEFLSMKLAYVNPRLQFNTKNECLSKDVIQPNSSKRHPMYPIDSLATTLYGQPNQNSLTTREKATMVPSLNSNPVNENSNALQTQLPLVHGFPNLVSQLPSVCEGDLQSIVQMGYVRKENGSQ